MKLTLPQQLEEFFKAHPNEQFSSGHIQRLVWVNKDGTIAAPRTVVRRLQELEDDKILKVEYREKNHAWYSWGDPPAKPKWEYRLEFKDGRPVRVPYMV